MITSRGIPEEKEPIHWFRGNVTVLHPHVVPVCRSVLWHIKYTDDRSEVTCRKCLGLE